MKNSGDLGGCYPSLISIISSRLGSKISPVGGIPLDSLAKSGFP